MKKLVLALLCVFTLCGCSTYNKAVNDISVYEKELEYCREGKKIWILERGNDKGVSMTSEIIGTCSD